MKQRSETLHKIRKGIYTDLEKLVKEQDKELEQKIREKYYNRKR
jgi:hypothetical protein